MNEEYININSNISTKYIGLRFFTVWRMGKTRYALLKFLKSAQDKKVFYLNNSENIGETLLTLTCSKNLEKLLTKNFKKIQ